MKKIFQKLLFIVPLVGLFSCGEKPDTSTPIKDTLTIIGINDFHGAFLQDDSYKQTGFSRIARYIEDERKDRDYFITLSSGDMFQGGAESNITKGKIVIDSMNSTMFDSMTVGNHEFDWTEAALKENAQRMNFPLLGINVFYKGTNKRPDFLKPSTVINKNGLKVGIIGCTQYDLGTSILATIANNYDFVDPVELAKEEAIRLREKEKCDIIIVSTHDGSASTYKELSKDYNGAPYVDALFLGHDHKPKSGIYNNMPYLEGGCNGNYLARMDFDIERNNGKWSIANKEYKVVETSSFKLDSDKINNIYKEYESEISAVRDQNLYTFTNSVSRSNFSLFAAKSLLDFANKKLTFDKTISLGVINNGGIRTSVPVGEFTYGDLIKVYPFENVICVVKVDDSMINYYRNGSSLYSYETNDFKKDKDGYYYVATIDYVAFYNTAPRIEVFSFNDYLCRDVIAEILKTDGYNV